MIEKVTKVLNMAVPIVTGAIVVINVQFLSNEIEDFLSSRNEILTKIERQFDGVEVRLSDQSKEIHLLEEKVDKRDEALKKMESEVNELQAEQKKLKISLNEPKIAPPKKEETKRVASSSPSPKSSTSSTTPAPPPSQPSKPTGESYVVTAYTAGAESTGKTPGDSGYGLTSSGTTVSEGRTLSCPPELPSGTRVNIENVGERVCEDTGSAIKGKRLDLYIANLEKAQSFGKRTLRVNIVGR